MNSIISPKMTIAPKPNRMSKTGFSGDRIRGVAIIDEHRLMLVEV